MVYFSFLNEDSMFHLALYKVLIPIDVLSKLGGFDIAGMTGLFLGGAECGIPIVIDGVISAVSACLAEMISPGCRDFMLPSHVSNEPSARLLLEKLGLKGG